MSHKGFAWTSEHLSGRIRDARRERANAQTAGLDPILTVQEASPAMSMPKTPDSGA